MVGQRLPKKKEKKLESYLVAALEQQYVDIFNALETVRKQRGVTWEEVTLLCDQLELGLMLTKQKQDGEQWYIIAEDGAEAGRWWDKNEVIQLAEKTSVGGQLYALGIYPRIILRCVEEEHRCDKWFLSRLTRAEVEEHHSEQLLLAIDEIKELIG